MARKKKTETEELDSPVVEDAVEEPAVEPMVVDISVVEDAVEEPAVEPTVVGSPVVEDVVEEPAVEPMVVDISVVEDVVEEPAEPSPPKPRPEEWVWVRLEGARTAVLGHKSMYRGEARRVPYHVFLEANEANPGIFLVNYGHGYVAE